MIDQQDQESAFEDGNIVPVEHGHERSELVCKLAQELSLGERALDVFEWFEEEGLIAAEKKSEITGDARRYKELFFDVVAQAIRIIKASKTKVEMECNLYRLYWKLDMPLVDAALDYETPAQWSKKENISKEMSFRLANQFGDAIGLPRRRDQRSPEAREKMKQARLNNEK